MTTESENINVSKACGFNALQVRAGSSVNDAGTSAICDTPTAQSSSAPVHPGWVYFIRADGAIKIGHSLDPDLRLKNLQVGSPREMFLIGKRRGSQKLERAYHQRFKHLKIQGEWFRPGADLLKRIAKFSIGRSIVRKVEVQAAASTERPRPIRTRRAVRRIVSQFDSKQRRAETTEREMQYGHLIKMLKHRVPLPFIARQHEVMKAYAKPKKPRIRVQAVTSERRP